MVIVPVFPSRNGRRRTPTSFRGLRDPPEFRRRAKKIGKQKHTTGGIPRWSPTLVLVARFSACVWQGGQDAQFSLTYGRMCLIGCM
jgi:hypothetical protein